MLVAEEALVERANSTIIRDANYKISTPFPSFFLFLLYDTPFYNLT
jgi:hypothetical protein